MTPALTGPEPRAERVAELERESMLLRRPEEAEHALTSYFPSLRLGSADPARFVTRLRMVRATHFSLAAYSFETPGSADTGSEDFVIVESSGRGYRVEHGGREVDPGMYLAPADGLTAEWDAVRARAVSLDRGALEQVARVAAGDPTVRVRRLGSVPVSVEAAKHWTATVSGIHGAMSAAPEVYASPLIERAAFQRLAMVFLHAFPTGWRVPRVRKVGRDTVARAVEYLREHAGDAITVQDAAGAVHVSTRGLHAAFVRELGEPPSETLRRIRLEGARAELLAAPSTASAAAIATRWGFAHRSRFAAEYRRAYGELPSETLRR